MISFGSQKSSSNSTPVQLSMYSAEQQDIFDRLAAIMKQGINEVPSYPGNMYVEEQPEETQFFNFANNVANQSNIYTDALKNILTSNIYPQISPEVSQQYFANAILPGMRESYDKAMANTTESFAGPGYWSTARADAQRRTASNEALTESTALANLMYQNQLMNWQSNMAGANAIAGTALLTEAIGANIVGTAGQYARSSEEEKTLSDYQRWVSGETVEGVSPIQNNPFVQLAYQFLGLQPYTWGTKSSSNSSGFKFGLSL